MKRVVKRDGVIVSERQKAVDVQAFEAMMAECEKSERDATPQVRRHRDAAVALLNTGVIDRRTKHAKCVVDYADEVLQALEADDAHMAVNWTLRMMMNEHRLIIMGIEPEIITGLKHRRGGKKGNEELVREAKERHAEWQKSANQIWKKHPGWNKSDVARAVAEKTDGAVRTIRNNIVKPAASSKK